VNFELMRMLPVFDGLYRSSKLVPQVEGTSFTPPTPFAIVQRATLYGNSSRLFGKRLVDPVPGVRTAPVTRTGVVPSVPPVCDSTLLS
jgi:hypothetical protein